MVNAPATQTPVPTTEKAAPVNQTEVLLKILKSDDFLGKVVVSLKNTGLFRENVEQSAKDYVDTAIYAVQSPDNLALGDIRFRWKPEQTSKAILGLASKGLSYNPMQGLGYLVGYKIKDQPGQINVTPIPGVRGMERLIQRTGRVGAMKFTAVRANDVFECNEFGSEPPKHIRKHTLPNVPNPILYGCASIYVRSIEGYHNATVPVDNAAPVVPEPVVSTAPQFAPPSAPVAVVDDLDDNDPAMQAIAASKESVAASTPIKTLVPVAVTPPVQRPITTARPPRLV